MFWEHDYIVLPPRARSCKLLALPGTLLLILAELPTLSTTFGIHMVSSTPQSPQEFVTCLSFSGLPLLQIQFQFAPPAFNGVEIRRDLWILGCPREEHMSKIHDRQHTMPSRRNGGFSCGTRCRVDETGASLAFLLVPWSLSRDRCRDRSRDRCKNPRTVGTVRWVLKLRSPSQQSLRSLGFYNGPWNGPYNGPWPGTMGEKS